MAVITPIDIKKVEPIVDKIDFTADICLIRRNKEYIGTKEYDVKSLRIHAKKDKGNRIVVHDGTKVTSDLGYMEKSKVYAPPTHTILCGTDQEVEDQIKELGLKPLVEELSR